MSPSVLPAGAAATVVGVPRDAFASKSSLSYFGMIVKEKRKISVFACRFIFENHLTNPAKMCIIKGQGTPMTVAPSIVG